MGAQVKAIHYRSKQRKNPLANVGAMQGWWKADPTGTFHIPAVVTEESITFACKKQLKKEGRTDYYNMVTWRLDDEKFTRCKECNAWRKRKAD